MSEDLDLLLDAFEELSPEDKILFIDYNIHEYRELKREILKNEKKEKWKQKYKEDEEFRKRQSERQKKYRLKKKMEKEKNNNIDKDACLC
jgi:hypothetical protein